MFRTNLTSILTDFLDIVTGKTCFQLNYFSLSLLMTHAWSLREQILFQGRQLSKTYFVSLMKVVYSIRKEFAPHGSKFFPFRVDPNQKGLGVQESKKEVTHVISLVKKGGKSAKYILNPGTHPPKR